MQSGFPCVRAECIVGPRLPAGAGGAKRVHHISINPQADELFRRCFLRPALSTIFHCALPSVAAAIVTVILPSTGFGNTVTVPAVNAREMVTTLEKV